MQHKEKTLDKDCFVIQRFDGGHYDGLYDEVFAPAIRAAGLRPYRVDQDPSASIPIEDIEKHISEATACFAEISEDNPNVWFELGYAIAKEQPLCIVCNSSRDRFPFDIQHRLIIRYPQNPRPSDFEKLKESITERLKAAVARDATLRKSADAANALAIAPDTGGLQPHGLLALTLIYTYHYDNGISAWALAQDMQKGGYIKPASNLAIAGLQRKGFLIFREAPDQNGDPVKWWSVSDNGEDWLLKNQHVLNLHSKKNRQQLPGAEITDEDIPF